MSENEMGYRGSKSDLNCKSVKEQRVDGSCFGFFPRLRCTLMGGESRYLVKIPSKQLNRPLLLNLVGLTLEKNYVGAKASEGKKYYSSNSYSKSTSGRIPLDPSFLSGFSDAEASFIILISKEPKNVTH
jgi:hypothetical protein